MPRGLVFVALLAAGQLSHADEASALASAQRNIASGESTSVLFLSQAERDAAIKNMAQLSPAREIRAGDYTYALPSAPHDFSAVSYEVDGKTFTYSGFFARPEPRGVLVWQDGKILLEEYVNGNDEKSLWMSFSVAKSVTSMLIGAAIKDGYIESVEDPVTRYVPRFAGTGYANSTVKDVLQMSSGMAWNEDYADPDSDVAKAGAANGLVLQNYLKGLQRTAPSGDKFNYNTGETNLVGEILRAAIGNNASAYLEHKIWQPFGMEHNANWLLGNPGGGELGGCCINASLRDYTRIGIFALHGGRLPDGSSPLPDDWMANSVSRSKGYPGYGYLWWLDDDASYRARGIYGQQIYIDPVKRIVISVHSSSTAAVGSEYHAHLDPFVAALADSL